MSNESQAPNVVLTTSSPGLAWACVHGAGVDPYVEALITTPGVAIGDLDDGFGQALQIALQQTDARQIIVIGHRDDPIYATAAGLAAPPGSKREAPIQPGGLEGSAVATVRRTVALLSRTWRVPKGTVITGIVVQGDGSADNAALEVASGGRPPRAEPAVTVRTSGGREESLESLATELTDLEITPSMELPPRPLDILSSTGHEASVVPSLATPLEIPSGAVTAGEDGLSGPLAIDGEIASGPLGSSGSVQSGPTDIGGSGAEAGALSLGRCGTSGPVATHGAVEAGTVSSTGAIRTGSFGEAGELSSELLSSALTQVDADTPTDIDPKDDSWLAYTSNTRSTASVDESWADGSLQGRLEKAAILLGEFLDLRCRNHASRRDLLRMLKAGASPDPLMRGLQDLVRDEGSDLPAVQESFSTLEMAQSLLSRDEMLAVIRRTLH